MRTSSNHYHPERNLSVMIRAADDVVTRLSHQMKIDVTTPKSVLIADDSMTRSVSMMGLYTVDRGQQLWSCHGARRRRLQTSGVHDLW